MSGARIVTDEVLRLRAALEAAERERQAAEADAAIFAAERDALKDRAEAAELQVRVLEAMDLRSTLDAAIGSMNSYKAQADALREQVEAARAALTELAPFFDCHCIAAWTQRGLHQTECHFDELSDETRAALARLDLQETPTAPHPCQRCGSETWTDVDYSGCSDCREPADLQEGQR